ncbi:MAG: Crp/Fnr family transcriptional regulator [Proteobacteria bacterium]|nr:Crp/Fnr family transcriptional regulator [Pseudomonadota bacterium]
MTKNRLQQLEVLMSSLGMEHQQAIVDYATFMVQQYKIQPSEDARQEPKSIARPGVETVVAAIKRLKKTYYMLDEGKLLSDTSALMGQHIMQGKEASTVIDELETTFQTQYEQYLQND